MMSDLRVDVIDAHDAAVSEGHPVSIPNRKKHVFKDKTLFSRKLYYLTKMALFA
jgi:hypothetical protein